MVEVEREGLGGAAGEGVEDLYSWEVPISI